MRDMLVRESCGAKLNRGVTMGLGIYPCFKPRVRGAEFDSDGTFLLREYEFLDDIAGEMGLTPLRIDLRIAGTAALP
jgi:hypothetical protein